MLKVEVVKLFRECMMPDIRLAEGRRKDLSTRREIWNNLTDFLCKNGDITTNQYDNWCQPRECN